MVEPSELTLQNMDRIVTIQEVQAMGLCVRGQRKFWSSDPNLAAAVSFNEFVMKGTTVRTLVESGNEYVIDMINKGLANGQR